MLRVGTCSVCQTGNVGIRVSASGTCVVAMCDECDAIWVDKYLREGPYSLEQPLLPCPKDGSSLMEKSAHWATREEAEESGWTDRVIEECDALG